MMISRIKCLLITYVVAASIGTVLMGSTDNCASSPCKSGGTCINEVLGFSCICATGYSGTNCQTSTDKCAPNPCLNGGTCTDGDNSYTCTCRRGYSGTDCATVSVTNLPATTVLLILTVVTPLIWMM